MNNITLESDELAVTLDPDRGAEFTSLHVRRSGTELLGRTPWLPRALRLRTRPSQLFHPDSESAWLEGYRGGWQSLFPNAGPASAVAGAQQGFHGEASVASWQLEHVARTKARLAIELFTAPLRLDRHVRLDGGVLRVNDTVRNLAGVETSYDYVHHPAFGAPLISPGTQVDTGARTFVAQDRAAPLPAGRYAWPVASAAGITVDLSVVPEQPLARYGWLADFDAPWYAIRNVDLDLGVAVAWAGQGMDYAWLWQELHGTPGFPWFGRAYLMAVEPATTGGSGPDLQRQTLPPHGQADYALTLAVIPGRQRVQSMSVDGTLHTVS